MNSLICFAFFLRFNKKGESSSKLLMNQFEQEAEKSITILK